MKNKVEVLEYIAFLLEKKQAIPSAVEREDYRYIESGHIDSLGLMKFIIQIEDEFKIEISDDDMLSDSFQSLGGLVEIIMAKLD
tara:strand:- start:3833 stop:4084 length:252 start_codon:yes stop_codon:yes gene_type:complete